MGIAGQNGVTMRYPNVLKVLFLYTINL